MRQTYKIGEVSYSYDGSERSDKTVSIATTCQFFKETRFSELKITATLIVDVDVVCLPWFKMIFCYMDISATMLHAPLRLIDKYWMKRYEL